MADEKKAVGKYLLFNEGGFFYKYRLIANNGQALIISEAYKDEKACRSGIETLKKNLVLTLVTMKFINLFTTIKKFLLIQ